MTHRSGAVWRPWRRHGQFGVIAAALIAGVWMTTAPVVAQSGATIHVIQAGENLGTLAKHYGIDPALLAAYNDIADLDHILVGQALAIPPSEALTQPVAPVPAELPGDAGFHTVARGESLSAIARRYALSLDDLIRLNGLADANQIVVGQRLRLSARVDTTAAAPAAATAPEPADLVYVVQPGDTLSVIAKQHNTSVEQIMRANGLPNAGFVFVGQRLRLQTPLAADGSLSLAGAPADGERRIRVDLSDQTLTAVQGGVIVFQTTVATGKASTPTQVGEFAVYHKLEEQDMFGQDLSGEDWQLDDVPWVMYYDGEFAIHGAYWHANFGTPTSHGCVNVRVDEAKALYAWADTGTRVVVEY
jgi:LysM repeat protein